jgi:hypothetical protein
VSPEETLALARGLLERPDARTAGLWPRAAALLARQALEQGLDAYWRARGLRLDPCSTFTQLVCLREYLGDDALAGHAHHAWSSLSEACHHHPYEIAPGHPELLAWTDAVGELLHALRSVR